jgi:hypothetical protein
MGRDAHFSIISSFLKNAQITKKLSSTQEIIDALNKEQSNSNKRRENLRLPKIKTYFFGKSWQIN